MNNPQESKHYHQHHREVERTANNRKKQQLSLTKSSTKGKSKIDHCKAMQMSSRCKQSRPRRAPAKTSCQWCQQSSTREIPTRAATSSGRKTIQSFATWPLRSKALIFPDKYHAAKLSPAKLPALSPAELLPKMQKLPQTAVPVIMKQKVFLDRLLSKCKSYIPL